MGTPQPEKLVRIPADAVRLEGALALPEHTQGVVVFAHGSGSSRFSPRNNCATFCVRGPSWRTGRIFVQGSMASQLEVRGPEMARSKRLCKV